MSGRGKRPSVKPTKPAKMTRLELLRELRAKAPVLRDKAVVGEGSELWPFISEWQRHRWVRLDWSPMDGEGATSAHERRCRVVITEAGDAALAEPVTFPDETGHDAPTL